MRSGNDQFQKQLEQAIQEIWTERLRLIERRGKIHQALAHTPGGYVDGFRDALNEISYKAGIEPVVIGPGGIP